MRGRVAKSLAFTCACAIFAFTARAQDVGRALDLSDTPAHDAVVALINPRGFACSGVLVHARAVLSARHCTGVTHAVFGADVHALRFERRVVATRTPAGRGVDLALFVLDDPAPVAPYPIATPSEPPSRVRVVGFGCLDAECREAAGRRSFFEARLDAGDWGCRFDVAARSGCAPNADLVLEHSDRADTCVGDSGGGVLVRAGEHWAVIAITSRAVADSVLRCGDGGVYTRLSQHARWLKKELGAL